MHLDQAIPELIQVAGFLTLLLATWRSDSRFTKGVFLWFILSLSYDVFVWHCVRPHYVAEVYNFCNTLLGWGVLYEHYKKIIHRLVALFLSLFM